MLSWQGLEYLSIYEYCSTPQTNVCYNIEQGAQARGKGWTKILPDRNK